MQKRISADSRCTGCNMCVSVCPEQAISLSTDAFGFWYPLIDNSVCIDCGACSRLCPVYGVDVDERFNEPVAYAGWNTHDEIRKNSSSGGVFTALGEFILNMGGVLYGAAYVDDLSVEHIRVSSPEKLYRLQGSKYVQSLIRPEIYESLKRDLEAGMPVLFSGTPCQTAGVESLFGKYNNLVTVDVVCHGVPSPASYKAYLQEVSSRGKVAGINMREKSHGWDKFHLVVYFENGNKSDLWFNDDPWGKSFVRNLFLRESCYACEFKKYKRCADISLGDFWEAARGEHREFDDNDKGTSVVLVNSEKGIKLIEALSGCNLQSISYEWIPERTYAVARSSARNPNREKAFQSLQDGKRFSSVVESCTRTSYFRRVINKTKRMLGRE